MAAGRISGKYTRDNLKTVTGGRAHLLVPRVTEKHMEIVDALKKISADTGATVPQIALAWVQGRPGVTTTILGTRTLAQLEEDVKAIAIELSPEHREMLDKLTEPTLPFPHGFLRTNAAALHQGGTTVNGVPTKVHPYGPRDARE